MDDISLVHIASDLFAIGVVGLLLRIVWMQLNKRIERLETGKNVTLQHCETIQKMQEERYESLDKKLTSICADLKELRNAFFSYLQEKSGKNS